MEPRQGELSNCQLQKICDSQVKKYSELLGLINIFDQARVAYWIRRPAPNRKIASSSLAVGTSFLRLENLHHRSTKNSLI